MGIITLIETGLNASIESIISLVVTLAGILFAAIDESIALFIITGFNLLLAGYLYVKGMDFIIPSIIAGMGFAMITMLLYGKLNSSQVV